MKSNVLMFCDFEEQDYHLVAIHTDLQDYKLAFLLNVHLNFKLNRIVPDLDYVIKKESAFFSAYEHQDLFTIHLVKNKFKIKDVALENVGLFHQEVSSTSAYVYLQPEIKKADFVLKIQGENLDLKTQFFLKQLNQIGGIITAYLVDKQKLNHKEYLIF